MRSLQQSYDCKYPKVPLEDAWCVFTFIVAGLTRRIKLVPIFQPHQNFSQYYAALSQHRIHLDGLGHVQMSGRVIYMNAKAMQLIQNKFAIRWRLVGLQHIQTCSRREVDDGLCL